MSIVNLSVKADLCSEAPDKIYVTPKLHHINQLKSTASPQVSIRQRSVVACSKNATKAPVRSAKKNFRKKTKPKTSRNGAAPRRGAYVAPSKKGRRRHRVANEADALKKSNKESSRSHPATSSKRARSSVARSPSRVSLAARHTPSDPKTFPTFFRTTERQRLVYNFLKNLSPLAELQNPREHKIYTQASIEETLYPIVDAHDLIIVAGAYFGDEGKGKTVEAVSHHPKCTCIARVNSGENAGHTVYDAQGRQFVFNLLPSGILTEGKKSFIGPDCVMDPISFMDVELQQLIDAGISYQDRIGVGNVYIVTPYHKLLDLIVSAANSSTLKGISPAHAGKVSKHGIRLDHIFNNEATLRSQLQKGLDVYLGMLKQNNLTDEDVLKRCREVRSASVVRMPGHVLNFAKAKDKMDYLVELYRTHVRENKLFPPRCDVIRELDAAIRRGEKVLLEGPQSFWLSNVCEKFWVSSTSANTSALGLLAASLLNFQKVKSVVINVHKAPGSSRVGIGACPSSFVPQDFFSSQNIETLNDLPKGGCSDFDAIQSLFYNHAFRNVDDPTRFNGIMEPIDYTDRTGTYNIQVAMAIASSVHHGEIGSVTKKPRICGFFDCVLHHEVNSVQGPYLTISALDRADEYDRVGITIAYVYYSPEGVICDANGRKYKNGDIIHAGDPVPSETVLHYCHPIVKLVDGWKDTPISSSKREKGSPLPRALSELLSTIEHFTGCKVLSIGNGPAGNDIIYINQS